MEKKTNKTVKRILLIVLTCAILSGSLAGFFAITYQAEAVVNDLTQDQKDSENEPLERVDKDDSDDGSDEATAVLSQNVSVFTEDVADDINDSISNVTITNFGLYMEVDEETELSNLGIGDIFYLDGSEDTPLGEIYIGKISNITADGDKNTYFIETPMVDEVFDVLDFEYSQVMTNDNIAKIETIEGVNVTEVNDVSSHFTKPTYQISEDKTASTLSVASSGAQIVPLATESKKLEGLLFEYELDLLKAFNLKNKPEFFEQYNSVEGSMVTVYTTVTGNCYHRDTCPCVGRSKIEISLSEAIDEAYDPCYMCNPPVFAENKIEPSLTIEGKLGLESIDFHVNYDWDILNGNGIDDLSITANGNFLAEASLKSSFKYQLSGKTTELTVPLNFVKLQGLKEKLFPLAFIGYNGTVVTDVLGGNQAIRALTGAVPITVGAIIYIDINGNISVGATAYLNYNYEFTCKSEIVKDGEWVWDNSSNGSPKFNGGFEAELSGDADACLGASLSLYVFNLNIVELAIAKVGAEAEGNIKLGWEKNAPKSENGISGSFYMRVYCKLLELNVKLKTKLNFLFISASHTIDYSRTLKDITIAEWGTKSPTRYIPGIMSYSSVTASDSEAIYYKDTDGNLAKEIDGYRSVIYNEGFFSICGIDETYLYLMKKNDNGVYDIYRLTKDGNTGKKILEDVANCLTIDETYIYYVSSFDQRTINRYDRGYQKESVFETFSQNVKFMEQQGNDFHVVTSNSDDAFAALFGYTNYYYLLNDSGDIIANYGSSPKIENYFLSDQGSYYKAAKMISSGYLRGTAEKIYWMSKDKSSHVLTEGISGWNSRSAGIFTTLNNNSDGAPYKIVLYKGTDGSRIDVAEVYSDQAFFTLCQSNGGNWYFFDQTDTELILYTMSEDFGNLSVVRTFTLSEIPYNLTDCGMTIMNNRIYFYTMPNDSTSIVLYRYDIV